MKTVAGALAFAAVLALSVANVGAVVFDDVDMDDNQALTPDEVTTALPDTPAENFPKADVDKSGTLDRAEFQRALELGLIVSVP